MYPVRPLASFMIPLLRVIASSPGAEQATMTGAEEPEAGAAAAAVVDVAGGDAAAGADDTAGADAAAGVVEDEEGAGAAAAEGLDVGEAVVLGVAGAIVGAWG